MSSLQLPGCTSPGCTGIAVARPAALGVGVLCAAASPHKATAATRPGVDPSRSVALVPPTHTLIPPARHHVFVSCRLPAEDGDDDDAHADADLAAELCRHLQGKGLSVWWVSEETQTPKPQQPQPPSIIVASKASHSSPSSPQEPRRASFVDVEAGATSTKAAAPEAADQGFFAQAAMEVAKLTERLTGSSMVVKETTTNASSASAAFERADVNKDGVIDQSEFNAYLKSHCC